MKRSIISFHQDEAGHWVAELKCGHTQHVRHNPPWSNRPWVVSEEGRQQMLGHPLYCKLCEPVNLNDPAELIKPFLIATLVTVIIVLLSEFRSPTFFIIWDYSFSNID